MMSSTLRMRPAYLGKNFPRQGKRDVWEDFSRNAAKLASTARLVRILAAHLPLMMRLGMSADHSR
jgi:hypothetical protein